MRSKTATKYIKKRLYLMSVNFFGIKKIPAIFINFVSKIRGARGYETDFFTHGVWLT